MSVARSLLIDRKFHRDAWGRVVAAARAEGFRLTAQDTNETADGYPKVTVTFLQVRDEAGGDKPHEHKPPRQGPDIHLRGEP